MPASLFRYHAIDDSGRVVSGAEALFKQGRTKPDVYADPELKIPTRNPYSANAGGRMTLYLKAGEAYEVTVTTPAGVMLEQFVHTAIPIGGTVEVEKRVEVPVERVVEVERVVYRDPPDLAERLEAMETAKTKLDERPETPEAPPYSPPPPEIADLLRVSETYEQTNERLLPLFRDAKNRAEMAIDGENKTERMKWEAKAERLQSAINWNRGRAVETI